MEGMPALQELRAVGMVALQLPRAMRRRGFESIQYVAGRNVRFPVLLVHGYAASESVSSPLCRAPMIAHGVRLIRWLVPELIRTETLADATAPAGAAREPVAALCHPPSSRPGPLRLGTPCPPRPSM
jgi:hypothetical protein